MQGPHNDGIDPREPDVPTQRCLSALTQWTLDNTDGGIIPDYMLHSVARYLLFGERPDADDFLEAIICDRSFSEVLPRADDSNRQCLMTWHRLLYNCFPRTAHGSKEAMDAWCRQGGTSGILPHYLAGFVQGSA